ncbi:hypothetical protein GCM10011402_36760 [Paracoccus acridae]|uniref:Uncharacterized protein n=1 Tax=Paracoccus acridae TaxID=1795310 RepID=A0ABQ1VML6_9RHOB|nr:hypothetical protein GCM10011402_36760 [Paracoccus acridae]
MKTFDMTAPLCGPMQTHLAYQMPSGGGRIINANPTPLAPHPLAGEAPAAPNSEGKA